MYQMGDALFRRMVGIIREVKLRVRPLAFVSTGHPTLTVWESVENASQELLRNLAYELGIIVFRTLATFTSFGPRECKDVLPA